jgi:hypothetical protein
VSEQETAAPVISKPGEWAKRNLDIRELELPSGEVFRVKNVDLPTMVSRGYLPMNLVNNFIGMAQRVSKNRAEQSEDLTGVAEKDLADLDGVCRKFALVAVIEPHLTETEPTSEESINVGDLSFDDVMFIFAQCVKGGGAAFAGFFRGGRPGAAPRPDGESIRAEAVEPGGDQG